MSPHDNTHLEQSLTPDMEDAISVLEAYRPRVDMDQGFKDQLKQKLLLKKEEKILLYWATWASWGATACAGILVILGISRILIPPGGVQTPTGVTLTSTPLIVEGQTGGSIVALTPPTNTSIQAPSIAPVEPPKEKAVTQDKKVPDTTAPVSRQLITPQTTRDTPLASADTNMPPMMLANSPVAMTTAPTTPSGDEAGALDTEIADMVYEINTIIADTQKAGSAELPEYPARMMVYTKPTPFTSTEYTTLTGAEISATEMITLTPDILKERREQLLGASPSGYTYEIVYKEYVKGGAYTLVPTLRYTQGTGKTIDIPLIAGY